MDDQTTKLADTLYSSGLAGSPNEAKRMAESMLQTSKKVSTSSEEHQKTMYGVKRYEREQPKPVQEEQQRQEQQIQQEEKPVQEQNAPQQPQQQPNYNDIRTRVGQQQPINIQVEFDTPRREQRMAKQQESMQRHYPDTTSQFQGPQEQQPVQQQQQHNEERKQQPQQQTSGLGSSLIKQALDSVSESQDPINPPGCDKQQSQQPQEQKKETRMSDAERKAHEEADLTKHFNFSNR